MINCRFKRKDNLWIGFEMEGHAGYDDYGRDIVCAAVSSACELAINLCEKQFAVNADTDVSGNGKLCFNVKGQFESASLILDGLKDYLDAVKIDYPECISIKILEV